MPKRFGAASLVESIAFESRQPLDDGYGNTIAGDWTERYRCRAAFISIKGGTEVVMQARLEDHQNVIMRVRRCSEAEAIAADWRARDLRSGRLYNIRSMTNDNSRALIDILCEANVGG